MDVHQQEQTGPAAVTSVSCNDVYSFTKPARPEITLIAGLGVDGDIHAGVTVRHRFRMKADPAQPNVRQVHLIHAELHDEVRAEGYEVPPGGLGENVTTTGLDLLALPVGTILRFGPLPASAGPAPAGSGQSAGADGNRPTAAASAFSTPEGASAVVAAAGEAVLDSSTAAAVAALAARIEAEPDAPADPRPAVVIAGLRNPCRQINRYQSGLLKQVLGRDAQGDLVLKAGVMAVVLRGGPIRPGDPITVDLPTPPHLPLDRV